MNITRRHFDQLRISAMVRKTKNAKSRTLDAFVFSPIQTRIDNHCFADQRLIDLCSSCHYFARAIGAENDRQLNPGILTLSNKDVAVIDCGRS